MALGAFGAFVLFFIPMGFVVGFSAAAISASAWPFVVPVLLSFEMFEDFDDIFDGPRAAAALPARAPHRPDRAPWPPPAIILSVCIDLANALLLAAVYARQQRVALKPALLLGGVATLPAVAAAAAAQFVLDQLQGLLQNVSGYGLFGFAAIFLVRAWRLRTRAGFDALAGVDQARRASAGETEALTHGRAGAPEGHNAARGGCAEGRGVRMTLGQGGEVVDDGPLALLLALAAVCGALAGFIGFGNGMLFATMLIVLLDYETSHGAATASAATAVLMLAVLLCYAHRLQPFLLKYIAVAVVASLAGALVGSRLAGRFGAAKSNIFVGATLVACGLIASLPTWLAL
jgi:uncharacterized membrane protein YfcA